MSLTFKSLTPSQSFIGPLVCGAMAVLMMGAAPGGQATYGSPQEAVDALVAALRTPGTRDVVKVLGPEGHKLASSGDAVSDTESRERFLGAYDESHEIRQTGEGPTILYLGKDDFPFPIPLVNTDGKWWFDTEEGAEEILDRRIGENELATIQVMKAYVDAQREYADADRDGHGAQYARRLLSSDGKKDGLYWPTADDEPDSPFGPLVAEARSAGYSRKKQGRTPYHGYLFRVLTEQGRDAPGGTRPYIVGGRMIGGFALVAEPAEYGSSGVKTFVVNQDGVVYEKDLGPRTSRIVANMLAYDPDSTWSVSSD
jgi:hypothetical protein